MVFAGLSTRLALTMRWVPPVKVGWLKTSVERVLLRRPSGRTLGSSLPGRMRHPAVGRTRSNSSRCSIVRLIQFGFMRLMRTNPSLELHGRSRGGIDSRP